jgi:hypothetical protein
MGDLVGWLITAALGCVLVAALVPVVRHIRLVRREWRERYGRAYPVRQRMLWRRGGHG